MSVAANEKVATKFDKPLLVKTRDLWAACGIENDASLTKLLPSAAPVLAEIVMEPAPVTIETLVPAVRAERVYPVPFPISNLPTAGVEDIPVPPKATGRALARDKLLKLALAADKFPLKFPPVKKVKLLAAGFEKVEAARVSVILAEPTTSKFVVGVIVLIPKLPRLVELLKVIAKGAV